VGTETRGDQVTRKNRQHPATLHAGIMPILREIDSMRHAKFPAVPVAPWVTGPHTEDYTRWAREQYAIEKTVVEKFGLKP
jgi:hypothetical protein